MADQQKSAIDAAIRAGVRRIVKSAGMMVDPAMMIPRLHVEAEDHLKASGVDWTILRPNFFCQNLLNAAGAVRAEDRMIMPFPADVPIAMIDARDTADVAVRVLTAVLAEGDADAAVAVRQALVTQGDGQAGLGFVQAAERSEAQDVAGF